MLLERPRHAQEPIAHADRVLGVDVVIRAQVVPDRTIGPRQQALRRLPWSALRRFPRTWLLACLPDADLTEGRRRALEFMLAP